MNILVTGFEPWGSVAINPSGVLAERLGGHVLPVDFRSADRALRRLISAERPRAVLMLGLASGRSKISLESVALNVDHVEGELHRTIRKGGPLALESRLPLDRLLKRLRKERIPAALSHHAGTFVCNHVFYVGLDAFSGPCGFVHVPPFRALAQSRQLRAIRAILDELGGRSPAATR